MTTRKKKTVEVEQASLDIILNIVKTQQNIINTHQLMLSHMNERLVELEREVFGPGPVQHGDNGDDNEEDEQEN